MDHFKQIQLKLHGFIKKYYTSEIIKGSILFLSFGLLYFLFTLFIEYFLWLKPLYRTVLFWLFVLVEFTLLTRFIFFPVARLIGLKKGISEEEASVLIGKHFNKIDDRLLNILQLHNSREKSELLLASIEQKSANINAIPFKKAINYNANKKYIKYLSLPLLIWLFTVFTGNSSVFTKSFERVVHYKTPYQPPAPFSFLLNRDSLKVIQGKPFQLSVETTGEVIPQQVIISFNDQQYLMQNNNPGKFTYKFDRVDHPVDFHIEANGITSEDYHLAVISTPNILDFKMDIRYPSYIHKENEQISNTGNLSVPEGTEITWNLKTRNTDQVLFSDGQRSEEFKKPGNNTFSYYRKIKNKTAYQISSSNKDLRNYEKLNYHINVIKDEFPLISVRSDIDSVSRGDAHFIGQISDDHSLRKLLLVYKESGTQQAVKQSINILKSDFEEFFYSFPDTIHLKPSVTYELYFQVFDNDAVNGSKSTKSKVFYYNQKTKDEITEQILKEQQKNLEDIQKSAGNRKELNKALEEFSDKLKNKDEIGWNDKKDMDAYLKRQKQYQQMLRKDADKILDNLEELKIDEKDSKLTDKKEALKKRIDELKELEKNQKLLKELEKMSEKLKKEGLLKNLDKLTEKNKQQNRSLERILELVKQFYVEKKSAEIIKKLDSLAIKQKELSGSEQNNNAKEQEKLNKEFDSIQKDFQELNKQNKELKNPMDIPKTTSEQKEIKNSMQQAKDQLDEEKTKTGKSSKKNAKQSQEKAAKKMKALSAKMQSAMQQMDAETVEENIKDLQQILDNLLTFSFDQEALMLSFDGIDDKSADFPSKLKKQQILKQYFEHIDDSLYTLSLRLVKLTSKIQTDISNAHYNLDQSLENLSENKIRQGISNQQYTMTAANNLADLLSDLLQSLKNPKIGNGSGKGKKGESISLPDIIKKQNQLNKKMKDGMTPGEKSGKKNAEQMSGMQYQIYKEQAELRQLLQQMIKEGKVNGKQGSKAVKQMEDLEKMLIEKGLNKKALQNMQHLEHELLKLETAKLKQGDDKKRESTTGTEQYQNRNIRSLKTKKQFLDTEEILLRKPLPLQPFYQEKVKTYFKEL